MRSFRLISKVVGPVLLRPLMHNDRMAWGFSLSIVRWNSPIGAAGSHPRCVSAVVAAIGHPLDQSAKDGVSDNHANIIATMIIPAGIRTRIRRGHDDSHRNSRERRRPPLTGIASLRVLHLVRSTAGPSLRIWPSDVRTLVMRSDGGRIDNDTSSPTDWLRKASIKLIISSAHSRKAL